MTRERATSANMDYTTMRGAVLRMTVLCKVEHLCFVLKFGGNNPALRVAQNRCLYPLKTSIFDDNGASYRTIE